MASSIAFPTISQHSTTSTRMQGRTTTANSAYYQDDDDTSIMSSSSSSSSDSSCSSYCRWSNSSKDSSTDSELEVCLRTVASTWNPRQHLKGNNSQRSTKYIIPTRLPKGNEIECMPPPFSSLTMASSTTVSPTGIITVETTTTTTRRSRCNSNDSEGLQKHEKRQQRHMLPSSYSFDDVTALKTSNSITNQTKEHPTTTTTTTKGFFSRVANTLLSVGVRRRRKGHNSGRRRSRTKSL